MEDTLLLGAQRDKALRLPGAYRHALTTARNVRVAAGKRSWADVGTAHGSPRGPWIAGSGDGCDASPFSARVEALWRSGEMAALLDDAAARGETDETDETGETGETGAVSSGNAQWEGAVQGEQVRLTFTLCAGSYATTFLGHLQRTLHPAPGAGSP